jgi:hypothetical protein
MSDILFPRTEVAGVSLSRMIIGTNWMLGWSHRSPAQDHQIKRKFSDGEKAFPLFKTFLDHGVDTVMGPLQQEKVLQDAVRIAQEKTGKQLILIDTPVINVEDSAEGRRQARETIRRSKEFGATFCLVHHSSAEALVNKNKHIIDRLPDYLDMIRPTKKIMIAALRENPPLTGHGITDIFLSVPVMKRKLTEKLDAPELEPLRDSDRFRALREEVDSL